MTLSQLFLKISSNQFLIKIFNYFMKNQSIFPSIKLTLIKKSFKSALHNDTIHSATHTALKRYLNIRQIPSHNKGIQWKAIDGLSQSVYDDEWTKTTHHCHQLNGLKNLSLCNDHISWFLRVESNQDSGLT